uniref:PSI_integrin domain-containing protein n=1 Tax=Meloidogyne hapla TaxID=6305 RepID=A0A1I8B6I2_MELHA
MERTTDQMKGMTFMLMLLMFFISMDCAPTPEKEVILARRSDLFPCPNCEEWCKNDPKYICKYSCEVDFDKSPELNKPCEEYNKTEKCAPTAHQNPTDKYMMVFSARYYGKTTKKSWVMSSSFDIRASTHHKTFLESCGL